jgi:hypothetical protein
MLINHTGAVDSNAIQVSKLLQTYLGQAYDVKRDWTSDLRTRFGHPAFTGSISDSDAPFTLKDPESIARMTDFVIENGFSKTLGWQEQLRQSQPVYHLDLAIGAGGKGSAYVTSARHIERVSR